jgi:Arc/MetJ-type ribon-helix-helix transcriptional regulator
MSMKNEYTIELNDRQHEFLERMVQAHGLPDVGKAVRCLVDFAMHEPGEQERVFDEIRCSGCRSPRPRLPDDSMGKPRPVTVALKEHQVAFLERMVREHSLPDIGKAVRCLIDFALAEPREQARVFTKIRCRGCSG